MSIYTYRTDAVQDDTEFASEKAAIAAAVAANEWAEIGSEREARDIEDGGWMCVYEDGIAKTIRGTMS